METHGLLTVVSFLGFLALFVFVGLLISRLWLMPAPDFDNANLFPPWQKMFQECLAMLTFAGIALLLLRTAEMNDASLEEALLDLPLVFTQTHFGWVWCLHLGALLVLWMGGRELMASSRAANWAMVAVLAAVLVLAFTYSATSHASDNGDFTFAEINDCLHVVSTAVWGGAILASAAFLFPALKSRNLAISTVAVRLSNLAAAALAAVLITGVCNAWLRIPGWTTLTTTNYGLLLSVKVGVVALMVMIGAFNRFFAVPRVQREASTGSEYSVHTITRVLIADAMLVVVVLIMAAALGQIDTPSRSTSDSTKTGSANADRS